MHNSSENVIIDFIDGQVTGNWEAIDDRIMGGCSKSQPKYVENVGLRFAGTVSLENNGGFASIRSPVGNYNLGRYSGLRLRLLGDGKTYKLGLRTDLFFDGISYQATFATDQDTWQEIVLPFEAFIPTHHGIRLSTVASMDLTRIKSFGLFISDHQKGSFQLDIAWIKGY